MLLRLSRRTLSAKSLAIAEGKRWFTSRIGASLPRVSSTSKRHVTRQNRSKFTIWARRLAILGAGGGVVYVYDKEINASALTRSLRTGYIGLVPSLSSLSRGPLTSNHSILCTLDCKYSQQELLTCLLTF